MQDINKKPFQITFTQSAFINEIASLPEYQNSYGAGFHKSYGAFFSNWGAPFSSRDSVPHPYGNFSDPSLQQAFPQFVGQQLPYRAYKGPENSFKEVRFQTLLLTFLPILSVLSVKCNFQL